MCVIKMRANLRPSEKLILQSQKHWIVLVKPSLIVLLFIILASVAMWVNKTIGMLCLALLCVPLLYLLWKVLERKYDIWVVTNLRIIDEFGVLSHSAKESPIDKVHNVSFTQSFWGRLLGYGNVQIQTAAESGTTTYHAVNNPRLLADTITKCQADFRQAQIKKQAEQLAYAIKNRSVNAAETKECPYCAEIIKAKAKLCRFCGKVLV